MAQRQSSSTAISAASRRSTSETLFRGAHGAAGEFRCPRDHPNFAREGRIRGFEIAFPRTAVRIRRTDRPEFVADANLVTLYNRDQAYERAALDLRGDNCDWLAVDEATARELVARFDPAAAQAAAPFRYACAPGAPLLSLRARRLFDRLRASTVDELETEEEILGIFDEVLDRAYSAAGTLFRAPVPPCHAAVGRARELLALHFRAAWTLGDLAKACGLSSFRLARLFRETTGSSLHAARIRLRLHAALERLGEAPRTELTDLALELGFSSHAHFSASFKQAFGISPSQMRSRSAASPAKRTARADADSTIPIARRERER